jgi:hypothetical protein
MFQSYSVQDFDPCIQLYTHPLYNKQSIHDVGFYVGVCNGSGLPLSNGFILVEANGGLNQQRSTVYILFILSCMLKHVRQ